MADSKWTTQYRDGEIHFHLEMPTLDKELHLTMSATTAHAIAMGLLKAVLDGATEERAGRMLGR